LFFSLLLKGEIIALRKGGKKRGGGEAPSDRMRLSFTLYWGGGGEGRGKYKEAILIVLDGSKRGEEKKKAFFSRLSLCFPRMPGKGEGGERQRIAAAVTKKRKEGNALAVPFP